MSSVLEAPQGGEVQATGGEAPAPAPAEQAVGGQAQSEVVGEWIKALPEDLRAEQVLQTIKDIPTLAQNYVHSQRMIGKYAGGKNVIAAPNKHSTDQEWSEIFQKLGLPADLKEYELSLPEDAGFEEDFVNSFKETAHKAGVLPKQAAEMLNWYSELNKQAVAKSQTNQELQENQSLESLKSEWGAATDQNLNIARRTVQEFGTPEVVAALDQRGMGNDPAIIKMFFNIGKGLLEDSIPQGGEVAAKTPGDAQKEIAAIRDNPAYWDGKHPNHAAAVKEMAELHKFANPT